MAYWIAMPARMQTTRSLSTFLLVALFHLASCGGGGSSGSPGPTGPALGMVNVLSSTTCPSGPGALANTACMHLAVDGLNVPAIEVELRVTEADTGVPLRGTVLLGTGLLGTSFFGEEAGGDSLLPALAAAGFRIVDRAWVTGWFASGSEVMPQSARYATLATWVHDNLHTAGFFCVVGQSGGAGEIAYSLTSWERDSLFDVAVLSSGPPMSRLDYLCEDPPSPEWFDICMNIVPNGAMECGQPACTLAPGNLLCSLLPQSPQPGQLEADSILHAEADLSYPNTLVHTLLGAQDCSSATPLGLLFLNSVTSQKALEFVTDTPHLMPSTPQGRDALVQALVDATTTQAASSPWRRWTEIVFEDQ